MPSDREIVRQIFVDNGYSPHYYRFQRDLDITLNEEKQVVAFALPIQAKCNLGRIPELQHLRSLTLKKTWQSRVPVPDLSILRNHPALEQVVFESVLIPDPRVIGGLNISRIHMLSFRFVKFAAWTLLAKFQDLAALELHLHNPVDWITICSLRTLKRLCIVYGGIKSLSGIEYLKDLESLTLLNNLGINRITELTPLHHLKDLHLSGAQVHDLAPLKQLPQINILEWHDCPSEDYSPIAELTDLVDLDLYRANVTNGGFLTPLQHLRTLNLEGTGITDLTSLTNLQTLETLNASWTSIQDLSPLANLSHLSTLELNGTKLKDLSPLAGNPALKDISLIDSKCSDITPLGSMPNLRRLHLRETPNSRDIDQIEQIKSNHPELEIVLYPFH